MKQFVLFLMLIVTCIQCNYFPKCYKLVTKEDAITMLKENKSIQLVDVRTVEEFNVEAIPGAVNMDVKDDNFKKNIQSLNKTQPVLVYCKTGSRGKKAVCIMHEMGFNELYVLQGGYEAF